jgi:chromosomal replication initiation ATPase DnaA
MSREALILIESQCYLEAACHVAGVSKEELLSDSREWRIKSARHMAAYAMWINDFAAYDIAYILQRDRTSILHAVDKIKETLKSDKILARMFDELVVIVEREQEIDIMDILREANGIK